MTMHCTSQLGLFMIATNLPLDKQTLHHYNKIPHTESLVQVILAKKHVSATHYIHLFQSCVNCFLFLKPEIFRIS
jgi:hypothetical protein